MIKKTLTKRIITRFIKGFIGGAAGSMIAIAPTNIIGWGDVATWLNLLALSGVIGGISGSLLAFEKWVKETM